MSRAPAYAPHRLFVAPARAYPQLWRLGVGLFLATFAYLALNQIFFRVIYGLTAGANSRLVEDLRSGATPVAMYILLFSFVFMSVGAGLSARVMHHRSFASLLGPLNLLWQQFRAVSFAMIAVMAAVFLLPPYDMGGDYVPNMPLGQWLVLLLPSLFFVLVQVSAEEIVFRGYVQQQLAARFRSPLVWMILPSVLFALGHYLPDAAGENALTIALWACTFGVLMADLTARAGTLGPAIAVHFWNNVSAILIVSLPDELSGLALYLSPFSMDDTEALQAWLPVDFAMMFVLWLAARVTIRR
ncbi:lysostaphin resistance A-like protein [Marimonas sp. MJW-29]|uniref:Lysostaphin resistance A-like protein n=1 Tax=Sulfitobacter sediminis TaxID=3234186 RepID=A0ABV3RGQ2_9RHOB